MSESPNEVVYINCWIEGEPAKILRELCSRGPVRSYTDAINQIPCLHACEEKLLLLN